MNIGSVVKNLRVGAGVSQGDLADACDLSQTYLSQVERNRRTPHMNSLEKIANTLNIPLPILLFLSIEESDIPDSKRQAYELLFPAIKAMLTNLFPISSVILKDKDDSK